MIATVGYVIGGAVAVLSAAASLYFAGLILSWTFGANVEPWIELLHFGIWLVPVIGSVFFLRWVWQVEQKGGRA